MPPITDLPENLHRTARDVQVALRKYPRTAFLIREVAPPLAVRRLSDIHDEVLTHLVVDVAISLSNITFTWNGAEHVFTHIPERFFRSKAWERANLDQNTIAGDEDNAVGNALARMKLFIGRAMYDGESSFRETVDLVVRWIAADEAEDPAPDERPSTFVPGFPLRLVQLSTFPEASWPGRAVFHPGCQTGDIPYWHPRDYPGALYDPAEVADWESPEDSSPPRPWVGDAGVVVSSEPDPNFSDLGVVRVHFMGSFGSMLHYAATNLWTPAG